jgi:hypothetical protein
LESKEFSFENFNEDEWESNKLFQSVKNYASNKGSILRDKNKLVPKSSKPT